MQSRETSSPYNSFPHTIEAGITYLNSSSQKIPLQIFGEHNLQNISAAYLACKELGIEEEKSMLVQHMLISHHGEPEYGAAKLPMFPEAEVLSTLDRLDAQLFEMFTALDGVVKGGFSERQWALDNRQLYQHGRKGIK